MSPVSPSLFETDHAHQDQTGLVQRCSRPHGQPETVFLYGVLQKGLASSSIARKRN